MLLLLPLSNSSMVGIYENLHLKQSLSMEGKTSHSLPLVFKGALEHLDPKALDALIYPSGPGNFSILRLSHVFAQSIALSMGLRLYSLSSFCFTSTPYIKAYASTYFHTAKDPQYFLINEEDISLLTIKDAELNPSINLPLTLNPDIFISSPSPQYILPAV